MDGHGKAAHLMGHSEVIREIRANAVFLAWQAVALTLFPRLAASRGERSLVATLLGMTRLVAAGLGHFAEFCNISRAEA